MDSELILGAATSQSGDWVYLVAPLTFYLVCVGVLFVFGRPPGTPSPLAFPFAQIADSLKRLTGFPGWAMAGALTGLLFLLIAVIGFYWDVAWHVDYGRDDALFTPAHVMILVGLGGIVFAGVIAAIFARIEGDPIPWSAVTLAVMGAGALVAFPIDDLWHAAYGLDLTLWSPPHLQLITGGGFATLAVLLLLAEARPQAYPTFVGRAVLVIAAGAALTGMSVFQGEFDFGIPQFQLVYLPVLVAATAGFTLVLVRIALGPGGAIAAVLFYLVLRGAIAWIVAGGLEHTLPRFPLYVAAALAVEAAALWVGTGRRLRFGLVAGALVGTVGLAGELAWLGLSGYGPASSELFPRVVLLAPAAGLAAALLGAGLARAFAPGEEPIPAPALALAGAVVIAALIVPLPRGVGDVQALTLLDRTDGRANVEVRLRPADAARDAMAFTIVSWQGGGRETAKLEEVGPGRYVSSRRVPVSGDWKSLIALNRGSEVMAAPLYLPADREIGASAVPAARSRQVSFVRNTEVLLREAKPGGSATRVLAYGAWLGSMALWIGLLAFTAGRIRVPPSRKPWMPPGTARPRSTPPAGPQPAERAVQRV